MMEWYQVGSFFFTNGLRIILGLYLAITVLNLSVDMRKTFLFSVCTSALVTVLCCFSDRQFYITGAEIIIMVLPVWYLFRTKMRMFLFLIFYYEIAAALWEFMVSAGLGVLFRSEDFLDMRRPEHMAAVWIVRLLMLGAAFLVFRAGGKEGGTSRRFVSMTAVAGLIGMVLLSGQNVIIIDDEQMNSWVIFSMVILMAVMLYYLNGQYEMEKKIASLEKEKNLCRQRKAFP